MKSVDTIAERILDFNEKYIPRGLDSTISTKEYEKKQEKLLQSLNKPFFFGNSYYSGIEVRKFSKEAIHFVFNQEFKIKKDDLEKLARDYKMLLNYNNNSSILNSETEYFKFSYNRFLSIILKNPKETKLFEEELEKELVKDILDLYMEQKNS